MELPIRSRDDVYVPDGGYHSLVSEIQKCPVRENWSSVIVYAFDQRTRVMPFRSFDSTVVPCGARSLAASLLECGFHQTRVVLQQWTPKFQPSAAVRNGYPIDLLLISSMGLHAGAAYRVVKDAQSLGANRPLILMGGPKAIYEPEDCFGAGDVLGGGVDVACTGEEYVLLELLRLLADEAMPGERPLSVFRRVRVQGSLDNIPGLVYRAPDHESGKPYLINTGVQRLVRDLDELPMPLDAMKVIEPAHRRQTLSVRPMTFAELRKKSSLATLVTTHGCRFNCEFCPIPAYQQRTWRHKSPDRIVAEIKQLGESLGYRYFFGTDDNFFNHRESTEGILSAMSKGTIHGKPFRKAIHFITEATEFDVFKQRDLLPLARDAGVKTLLFGVEDLNAKLVNKGQTVNKTEELFRILDQNEINPYAMMIHHDDQPLWSTMPGRLGLVNQAARLFRMGAVGYHTTYITPSQGARNLEPMYDGGTVLSSIGGRPIPEAYYDGTHVIASRHRHVWVRQLQIWAGYLTFYNPLNFVRALCMDLRKPHKRRWLKWQFMGAGMVLPSILKMIPYTASLAFQRVEKHKRTPPRCLPMINVESRQPITWAVRGYDALAFQTYTEADGGVLQQLSPVAVGDAAACPPHRT